MIKLKAIQDFTLKDYKKLKNIQSKKTDRENNKVYNQDIFECDEKMARYLLGDNSQNIKVVEVIEIINENKKTEKKKK